MRNEKNRPITLWAAAAFGMLILAAGAGIATATEPCGDFGECKALIEINSSDGDIGFHFLMDGDDLNSARINDPNGIKVFEDMAKGPMTEQKLTETFAESAEPLCWEAPGEEEDWEDIVTLEEFLELWTAGTYHFTGMGDGGEKSEGETTLSHALPAAPTALAFNGSAISWSAGTDLGNCANGIGNTPLAALIGAGVIPDPATVPVAAWEVVLEPDVDDGDPTGALKYSIRVTGDSADFNPAVGVTVPSEYLSSLPDDTPVKIEVGAIGVDDNATFTEADGFCVNVDEGCED